MNGRAAVLMRLGRRWRSLICLPFLLSSLLLAQDTGQLCVQSFEDGNSDGKRDAHERAITRGVGAGLQNAAGVTIASRLLEDSPFAARGLICFEGLLAGDYRIIVTSAEYAGVASSAFAARVNPGAPPMLVEFGLSPLDLPSGRASAAIRVDAAAAEALVKALIGSMIAGVLMSVIGLLVYLLVFRRRLQRGSSMPNPAALGLAPAPALPGMPPLPSASMPADRRQKHAPSAGSPLLFADDETDAPRQKDS